MIAIVTTRTIRPQRNLQRAAGAQQQGDERATPHHFASFRLNADSTAGCTNSDTLPPSVAISRTSVEEMKVSSPKEFHALSSGFPEKHQGASRADSGENKIICHF